MGDRVTAVLRDAGSPELGWLAVRQGIGKGGQEAGFMDVGRHEIGRYVRTYDCRDIDVPCLLHKAQMIQ